MRGLVLLTAALLGLAAGCGGGKEQFVAVTAPPAQGFTLSASVGGATIAGRFTCDGTDTSPALTWTGVPDGTRELVLVLEDPDASGKTFTHWLVYGLSPNLTSLPEGIPARAKIEQPTPLRQGKNDFGSIGYSGPCPPKGQTHRYVFRLLAVDRELGLEPASNRKTFEGAIEGRVIAEARFSASYGR
jgi:Raf kinase inhibitor-like YbhB/YbcL family protein